MATLNMNQAVQAVRDLDLQAQLIPSKSNPMNCQYIYIGKDKLKTSQLSGKAIREMLEAIKNGCKAKELEGQGGYKETLKTNISEFDSLRFIAASQILLTSCNVA